MWGRISLCSAGHEWQMTTTNRNCYLFGMWTGCANGGTFKAQCDAELDRYKTADRMAHWIHHQLNPSHGWWWWQFRRTIEPAGAPAVKAAKGLLSNWAVALITRTIHTESDIYRVQWGKLWSALGHTTFPWLYSKGQQKQQQQQKTQCEHLSTNERHFASPKFHLFSSPLSYNLSSSVIVLYPISVVSSSAIKSC